MGIDRSKPGITERFGTALPHAAAEVQSLFTPVDRARFKKQISRFNRATGVFDRYEGTTQGGKVRLGQGGFGSVTLGWDWRRMRKVAVKGTKAGSAVGGLSEALVLAQVNSKHVVRVYDLYVARKTNAEGATYNKAYLTMEVLSDTLLHRLERGERFSEKTIKRMVRDMLEGVQAFHDAGYGHYDLHARNVGFRGKRAVLFDAGMGGRAGTDYQRHYDVSSVVDLAKYMFNYAFVGEWSGAASTFMRQAAGMTTARDALQHPWLSEASTPAAARLWGVLKRRYP